MKFEQIDHLVITVHNIEASCDFYSRVLGMEVARFADNRMALTFGRQKINLHEYGNEFEPSAANPVPGANDLCLLSTDDIKEIIRHLQEHDVTNIEGPIPRTGATGPILSVYFRDPDGNLLEIGTPFTKKP